MQAYDLVLVDTADLNESPSQKEGKCGCVRRARRRILTSMKALPRRKGNFSPWTRTRQPGTDLNESPSQKEGKLHQVMTGQVASGGPQ